MAEIHINPNDIESIINLYSKEDSSFAIRSFVEKNTEKTCKFYLNGDECTIKFYIKRNSVNIMPIGKNITTSKKLVDFIKSKGFSKDVETNQFVFQCTSNIYEGLVEYISNECNGLVSISQNGNITKFTGYNGDEVTFSLYPDKKKAMIQGRPFHAYSIIVSYLSQLPDYTFDQIVEINNSFACMNTPSTLIRKKMEDVLSDAYTYLDEALLKSISGSLALLKQKTICEDYTGCVTGAFKAIEGYLKKLLTTKYGYKLEKKNTFKMFYMAPGKKSEIHNNSSISKAEQAALFDIYNIYSSKRNIYLHATIDPSQTRIIQSIKDADDIVNEILVKISDTYNIIMK